MKKNLCYLMVLLLLNGFCLPVVAEEEVVFLEVEGRPVDRQLLSYREGEAYYIPLYDAAEALGAYAMIWNPETGETVVEAEGLRLTCTVGEAYLEANGRAYYLPGGVRRAEETVLVTAESLAWAFGARVCWREEIKTLSLTATGLTLAPAEEFYSAEDLDWLSRIISAEARGESLAGQIAVGNVVLNRVKSEDFPDTVKEVILDRHYGIQFSPAYTKEIKKAPSESAVLAAKLCLEGANTAGESLYFASTAAARTCWAESHRKRYDTIGHQVFYI